jgi:hypothetical protein
MFRCTLCGEEYEDEGDLGMHLMWGHHLAEEIDEEEITNESVLEFKEYLEKSK